MPCWGSLSKRPLVNENVLFFVGFFMQKYRFSLCLGPMSRVFANGLRYQGSIPGRVILETQKMVLDAALLNTQNYKVRITVKGSNPVKRVAPSQTPRCSNYWKGSIRVILDLYPQLYFMWVYVCVFICVCVCGCLIVWFYGISTFIGYLIPNPFS